MQLRLIASSIVTAGLVLASAGLTAQVPQKPLRLEHAVQDKTFYLLSAIERDARVSAMLSTDKELGEIRVERRQYLNLALRTCGEALSAR